MRGVLLSVLAVSPATACICTKALFNRIPMHLCHQLVDPFCAVVDEARENSLSNTSLVVDVGAAYGLEAMIARRGDIPSYLSNAVIASSKGFRNSSATT